MRNTIVHATPVVAVLALAGQLFAGGFYLTLGNPDASPEARRANAAVTVRAAGCHDPATAKVTATAIGIVDGQRREIPLRVEPLSEPGLFAVARQWPKEGKWVIKLVGKNGEQSTNTLAVAGPRGVDRDTAKLNMNPYSDAEVDALLR